MLLHVTSFMIHLLLIFAVISFIMHFVTGKRVGLMRCRQAKGKAELRGSAFPV